MEEEYKNSYRIIWAENSEGYDYLPNIELEKISSPSEIERRLIQEETFYNKKENSI